jgi:hypothetical protein
VSAIPNKTQFYITGNMLQTNFACSTARARFRKFFKVEKNDKVFLTFENFNTAVSAGLSIIWVTNHIAYERGYMLATDKEMALRDEIIGALSNAGPWNATPSRSEQRARRRAYELLVRFMIEARRRREANA